MEGIPVTDGTIVRDLFTWGNRRPATRCARGLFGNVVEDGKRTRHHLGTLAFGGEPDPHRLILRLAVDMMDELQAVVNDGVNDIFGIEDSQSQFRSRIW
jgi:hypothetical protein